MTTRIGSKNKKVNSKGANSSSSTTSSSKQYPEVSIDGLSSPASSSMRSKLLHSHSDNIPAEAERSKENVTVTVRFRPLSQREIRQGEEIAWYADGDTIVRNENTPSIAYAYDRVFGPTTTTRHVYDVAAQHAISGAMEGINGTIFAYGVTSSGKTHTMHGDQRSPGIIPLAVKDAFSIIQETPNREFLLRVSYLEIYNEVVNDLLNPAGQNLRIREDAQGTFVEGIKEEVVLSPAHALSLIAAGEEHRHVGSTNFNLLSSRSHTIFTLIRFCRNCKTC
ncbi:microtubule binding motor protein [Lithospermum erythrorhizon]|uniref:Microtubule binding motor protein n=1 Tax=Lithospermum erythrorhizon TaxID=34254 RepID=A0AAV3NWT0_LITER